MLQLNLPVKSVEGYVSSVNHEIALEFDYFSPYFFRMPLKEKPKTVHFQKTNKRVSYQPDYFQKKKRLVSKPKSSLPTS